MDQDIPQSSNEQQLLEEVVRYRELVLQNPCEHKADLAAVLYNLGEFYAEENRSEDAEPYYLQAVSYYMEVAEESPQIFRSVLAAVLSSTGVFYVYSNRIGYERYEQAKECCLRALAIQQGTVSL
ncbi:MAG TPA: hypothetical protein O0X44_03840 [Methanocorpusculum sp.]|nr:hypothetical protein [Methanocorpusculum sp.]HJK41708.1 hypothetical protein [Methanocorpusculum sp.]